LTSWSVEVWTEQSGSLLRASPDFAPSKLAVYYLNFSFLIFTSTSIKVLIMPLFIGIRDDGSRFIYFHSLPYFIIFYDEGMVFTAAKQVVLL
jgi:hypothetical protein